MNLLSDFLKLIRFKNLFIIVLTQLLVKYVLISPNILDSSLSNFNFSLLVLSTILIAGAGNIINDYFDVKVDRLNNRKIIIGESIKRRSAIILHLSFSIVGIIIGFYLSIIVELFSLGFINLFCVVILWFYSTSFKKKPISGNLFVAFLSALVLVIIPLYDLAPKLSDNSLIVFYQILIYSLFAFLFSFIREVIKDLEDIEGDKKSGMKTFAISLGIKKTKNVLIIITSSILFTFFYVLSTIYHSNYYSFLFLLLLLTIPLCIFFYLLYKAQTKKDFSQLSLLIKLIMICGVLSMLII